MYFKFTEEGDTTMKYLFYALVGIVLILGGCITTTQEPIAGVVVTKPSTFGEGSYAPDITFTDLQGNLQSLSSFYLQASVIAFVRTECLEKSDPQLIRLASNHKYDVAVIEICPPRVESGDGRSCRMIREIKEKHIITLCDEKGIARNKFQITTPTAVFVLDKIGYIKAVGTIKDLEELHEKAESIVEEEERLDD